MKNLKITRVTNGGGYGEYKADITKYMAGLFDNVKSAYVHFWADNMRIEKERGIHYFSDEDISEQRFEYDGDKIEIEFKSGKTVILSNSEWGSITLKTD